MPVSINNTTLTFNDATTQTTAGRPGTVTSVATGNGLQGGTITTSGTLSVACPTFNTVGSYCLAALSGGGSSDLSVNSGSNYAAGSGPAQLQSSTLYDQAVGNATLVNVQNNLSGTWKWMGSSMQYQVYFSFTYTPSAVVCRVS
jgi:hypothetical protein